MSLIEGESLYIFPSTDLILDLNNFNGLVPDSPGFKKHGLIANNSNIKSNLNSNNNNNNNIGSSSNTSPEQISTTTPPNQQHQSQHSTLQYPIMNTNSIGGDDQFLNQIFLSQDKDTNLNSNHGNNNQIHDMNNVNILTNNFINNPNIIKFDDQQQHVNLQHQPPQPMHSQHDQYNNGILVPDSLNLSNNLIKKIDFNNEPIKHYVPEIINYDLNQPIYYQQQPNLPISNQQNNFTNSKLKSPKKKDEEGKIKKRKFISTTPVKGEHGTSLIPTTDGNCNLEEERSMKRQRRLVKNREAAQLFRQRQKAYIQDLEKKVNDLTSTNSEFRARAELLNSENKLIREQLLYLRNFITQAVSFSFPPKSNGTPNGTNGSGLSSPIPQGICPPDMLNLQNPMIMSAIAEAASKNQSFRQSFISIPSPPLSQSPTVSNTQQLVPFSSNNSPPQQMSITPPTQRK